ncbi:heparinase II/III family protein [Paenibacillus sp.]|uniref:heparinase II/III domain-containing protein n=1 Tax=Paenibacillus sp. TaxID=58172 RepID=UPI0028121075|nr:heparinase II/III family protein [Paenibacillus sp.]
MRQGLSAMTGIEVLAVRVLEPGERAELRVRAYREPGVYLDGTLRVTASSSDSSVVRVDGETIVGGSVGSAEVRVSVSAGDGPSFEQRLTIVVASGSPDLGRLVAGHPRILYTEEERLRLRQRIAAPESVAGIDVDRIWRELQELGESYMLESGFRVTYLNAPDVIDVAYPLRQPEPLPNPAGYVDYPFWTMYSRQIENRLVTLATLYGLTEERRYADRVRAMLLDLARYDRWYEFPWRGAEGNLSNAHFAIGAATAYDAVYDTMTEAERELVRTAILEKGLRPMSIDWDNGDHHNIIVAKQVAMLIGALAIVDEEPAAGKFIHQTYSYLKTYLDLRADSDETEGLMYVNVAAKHAAQAAVALKKATGDASLLDHRYLTEVVPELFFYFQAAGGEATFANLSDCHATLDLSYLMSLLAANAGHEAAMGYVERFEATKPAVLLNLLHAPELPKGASPDVFFAGRASRMFPRIGWAALRSGWGERDHALAFTSSPSSRDHNHYDQNHFILNVAGEWLLTDPGYQDYRPGPRHEYTNGTIGHNGLLVNGKGQSRRGGGRLTAWDVSPGFAFAAGEASDAYEGALRGWRRTIVHVSDSYYVVLDDIRLHRAEDEAELLFHSAAAFIQDGRPLAEGERLRGTAFAVRGAKAAVEGRLLAEGDCETIVASYPGAEEYGLYLKVRLRPNRDGRARLATLLAPSVGSEAALALEVAWEEAGVIVSAGDDRVRIDEEGTAERLR